MYNYELERTLIAQVRAGKVDPGLVSAAIVAAPTAQPRSHRLIEKAIYQAIIENKPMRRTRNGRTTNQVEVIPTSDHRPTRRVYFHGSLIAVVIGGLVVANFQVFEEWPSMTTASRLRLLGFVANVRKGKAMLESHIVYNSDFA